MFKFGENPPFGPPTPARVISVVGPEKDYYLKGRRSENQGLGIAAFAYYRRVVENQKRRIFEIIRVSQKIGASKEILDDLNDAKRKINWVRLLWNDVQAWSGSPLQGIARGMITLELLGLMELPVRLEVAT